MKSPKIHTIYIETTSKCNLACTYCHRTINEYGSKNKNMSLDVFSKIINSIDPAADIFESRAKPILFLHGYGEPTLNKLLPEMISIASSSANFSEIKIVSNLLGCDPERYRVLYRCGLTMVYVSLDSLDQDYVQASRVGTNLPQLMENIGQVSRVAEGRLSVITVLTKANVSHLPELYRFLEPLQLAAWNIQLVNEFRDQFGVTDELVNEARASLPKNPAVKINMEGFPYPSCNQPFDTLVVNVRGSVSACCTFFADDIISFGNVTEGPLETIYLSQKFQEFRREFSAGRPALCEECPYY